MCCRPALFCLLGVPALLMVLSGSPGQDLPPAAQDGKEQPGKQPGKPKVPTPTTVEQSFPSKGPMETAWKVEWETKRGYGLIIKKAYFKRGPEEKWMQVLGDVR